MKIASVLIILTLISPSGAAVIQNDAAIVDTTTDPIFPFAQGFTVNSATFIRFGVTKSGVNNFTFEYYFLSAAHSLFRVSSGTNFDADFVNSQPAFVSNASGPNNGILVLSPGQSAYLAYWEQGPGMPRVTAEESDKFGWARLRNSGGELVVSSSATADSGGIKVGTVQQIPEPATVIVYVAGVALSCVRRRRTIRG